MIAGGGELLKSIQSKSDWAVVVPSGVAGFGLDAALHLVPLSVASPGICAVVAAGMALAVKRSIEWRIETVRKRRLLSLALIEAASIIVDLERAKLSKAARTLRFEAANAAAGSDLPALLVAVAAARDELPVGWSTP